MFNKVFNLLKFNNLLVEKLGEKAIMKAIIIGAGPAGCLTASRLGKKGIDVEVYEEHSTVGRPISCTGLVTESISEIVRLGKDTIINRIRNAELICRNAKARIRLNEFVLDRSRFDSQIAEMAVKSGATIKFGHKLNKIEHGKMSIFDIKTKKMQHIDAGKFQNNNEGNLHIIGADGPNSKIANLLNPKLKREYFIGKQTIVNGNFEKDTYKVYLGSICPGFFGWIVPENEESARIGVASRSNVNLHFEKLIEIVRKHNDIKEKEINKIGRNNRQSIQAGLIPLFNPNLALQKRDMKKNEAIKETHATNYYIVGDAANQVKATTGGGIIPGLRCADLLAKSIINKGSYRNSIAPITRELKAHLFIRNLLDRFSDNDYNELVRIVGQRNVSDVLSRTNRDSPLRLMMKLGIAEPKLWKFCLKAL